MIPAKKSVPSARQVDGCEPTDDDRATDTVEQQQSGEDTTDKDTEPHGGVAHGLDGRVVVGVFVGFASRTWYYHSSDTFFVTLREMGVCTVALGTHSRKSSLGYHY